MKMWCFPVSEKERKRGKYSFQREEKETLPLSLSCVANIEEKYFMIFYDFTKSYGNIRLNKE